jgi:hypothetical protein
MTTDWLATAAPATFPSHQFAKNNTRELTNSKGVKKQVMIRTGVHDEAERPTTSIFFVQCDEDAVYSSTSE